MTRKTATVVIENEGRDQGKRFFITEMPAMQGAKWSLRVLQAIVRGGAELPPEVVAAGMAGLAAIGISPSIYGIVGDDLLLAETLACVQIIPDPTHPNVKRGLIESDFEEIATVNTLCSEVMNLHTGFSPAGVPSNSTSETKAPASTNTSMSTTQSGPVFHPARRSKR